MKKTDFNAPHVVFIGATGSVLFAEKSKKYHEGLKVIGTYSNFYEADRIAKLAEATAKEAKEKHEF